MPSKKDAKEISVGLLALIGITALIAGALPKNRFELDVRGRVEYVRTSWWGLHKTHRAVRLQNFTEWKEGRPFREPRGIDEFDWFIQHDNGEWSPIDFVGPLTE